MIDSIIKEKIHSFHKKVIITKNKLPNNSDLKDILQDDYLYTMAFFYDIPLVEQFILFNVVPFHPKMDTIKSNLVQSIDDCLKDANQSSSHWRSDILSYNVFNNDALTIMLYDEDIKSQFPEFVSQMADCYQKNIMKSDNIS